MYLHKCYRDLDIVKTKFYTHIVIIYSMYRYSLLLATMITISMYGYDGDRTKPPRTCTPRTLTPGHIPPWTLTPRTYTPLDTYPLDIYPLDRYLLGHILPGHIPPGYIPPGHLRASSTGRWKYIKSTTDVYRLVAGSWSLVGTDKWILAPFWLPIRPLILRLIGRTSGLWVKKYSTI